MTISELIAYADLIKPNQFDAETKLIWINEIEGMVLADVALATADAMKNYRYVLSESWTGTGVTFPTTETMLLPTACEFSIGGTVAISGLVTNSANNSSTGRKIVDISTDGLTLTFDDDSFTEGLTEDSGTAVLDFDGMDTELFITTSHDKLYRSYLCAMIDYANGEYDKYNNAMQMHNKQMNEFTAWYARTYAPADQEEEET